MVKTPHTQGAARDHGGGLDAAVALWGGTRDTWLDLSTGINPTPYPVGPVSHTAWAALPDAGALARLLEAARRFWNVPPEADIVAASGASALIVQMPALSQGDTVYIPKPTYNEHAAAFALAGFKEGPETAPVRVFVHPNNPDGRVWGATNLQNRSGALTIIDESFCDVMPEHSLIAQTRTPGTVVLKSFGKFWGLAGLRLGFAIAHPETFSRPWSETGTLSERMGPWSVSGPALEIGATALEDTDWANATRAQLSREARRLDTLATARGAKLVGGTSLFRLYEVPDAAHWQTHLAKSHVWSRIFPYSKTWLRLGLPTQNRWNQLEAAFEGLS